MRIIREHSRFRATWDFLILGLIFVSCVAIPFHMAFSHKAYGLSSVLVYAIDLVFLFDIFLNSSTSYRRKGLEITDKKQIVNHYLRGLFAVDLLACLPLDALLLAFGDVQVANTSLVLILRLLRMLRIIRLYVILRRWEQPNWINPCMPFSSNHSTLVAIAV